FTYVPAHIPRTTHHPLTEIHNRGEQHRSIGPSNLGAVCCLLAAYTSQAVAMLSPARYIISVASFIPIARRTDARAKIFLIRSMYHPFPSYPRSIQTHHQHQCYQSHTPCHLPRPVDIVDLEAQITAKTTRFNQLRLPRHARIRAQGRAEG
ncbi:hypothetical protein BDZ97DRAFT_1837981, partial [Flammula alnicola]